MAKKFFYNKVYNAKRTIINIIIIGVSIIGIVVCFMLTSNFQGENQDLPGGELSLKPETIIEVNEEFNNDIFFSKIENVDMNKIKVTYPDNYDVSEPGTYEVAIEIDGNTYYTKLKVVDTIKPELVLKEVTINEKENYQANDFVESCQDNSKKTCKIEFYNGNDEDGNKIDYSKYTEAGTYAIKIVASDEEGNQAVKETKLTINGEKTTTKPPENPQTCKYGNSEYDTENYLIAINITTNNCAVSLDLYKDETTSAEINKLMETETTRIQKDASALNLTGTFALNRKITAVVNNSGSGIVGYELHMTVTITNDSKTETVAEYKVDSNGKRVFITNPYNIAS